MARERVTQVFLSHTKLDTKFCNRFDNICAGVGIRRFRSEFEAIKPPAWETIKAELNKSSALFLMVGEELVKQQAAADNPEWRFTQNWISYEVGLAHEHDIDVWVVCDAAVHINFPVPYFNNYAPAGLEPSAPMQYIRDILGIYLEGGRVAVPWHGLDTSCRNCKIRYNLHAAVPPGEILTCPQCLQSFIFKERFPKKETKET